MTTNDIKSDKETELKPGPVQPTATDLSVIIVSYNTVNLLRKCLQSLFSNPPSDWQAEVIVVDNASQDGSAGMVEEEFPQVRLIRNTENLGFAKANNQAIALTTSPYILLLNPDTEIIEDAVWKMLAFLHEAQNAAVVGPSLIYPDGSFQHSAFQFPTLLQVFFDFFPVNWRLLDSELNGRYPRELFQGSYQPAFEVDFPLGACMMVKRSALQKIGSLDERFYMYMEEIDWCFRIKAQGTPPGYTTPGLRFRAGRRHPEHWRIYCLPAARVIHHSGASSGQFRDEMFYQLFKSRDLFYRKHYSHRFITAARYITKTGLSYLFIKAFISRKRGKMSEEEFSARKHSYRRVWRLTC